MAVLTVAGVYRDGRIELDQQPEGLERARVMVTFLPEDAAAEESVGTAKEGEREAKRRQAIARMMARMREGLDLGGVPFGREEIYEERMRELEQRRRRGR